MRLDLYGNEIPEEIEDEPYKKKGNLFEYLNNITHKKINIMDIDSEYEKGYIPYVINKFLLQHPDTVNFANEMNTQPHLPPKLQFDFFINTIRKKFRKSEKWLKQQIHDDLEAIKEYYNYSNDKAKDAIRILTDDQISYIKKKVYKGGLEK